MAHVFIVNEQTLNTHLKYMFAGTGAKDLDCNFLDNNYIDIKPATERLLSGMIADISRVKPGDDVLFYLQQTSQHEGMFFGSLKVDGEPFLCSDKYLEDDLGKNLTFRVKLIPSNLYSKGITERECLDSLKNINHPSELCWSLIYRKLKGNRGCTMITDYEYNKIMEKISVKNNKINTQSIGYLYDKNNNEIISNNKCFKYFGRKDSLDIKNRIIYKSNKKNSYETHLQAYILQNLNKLDILKSTTDKITWVGNEVSCGVGMQSMDICFFQESEENVNITICELKDEQPIQYIEIQIKKYLDWIKDYICPTFTKKIIINPTIITPTPTKKTKDMYNNIKNNTIEETDKLIIKPIRYIYFSIDEEITFEEVI